jgi:hypothetical protein
MVLGRMSKGRISEAQRLLRCTKLVYILGLAQQSFCVAVEVLSSLDHINNNKRAKMKRS